MNEVATNERAVPGGNNPPPDRPSLTALQAVVIEAEAHAKAKPKAESADDAAAIKRLLDKLRPALQAAEEERKANNAPHDRAIDANNKTYNEWTASPDKKALAKGAKPGKGIAAGLALKKIADDYLTAEAARIAAEKAAAAERQRLADEEARKAREEAERLANAGKLAEAAEATHAAEQAEMVGAQAGFERRQEPARAAIATDTGRAMTTRTTWHAEITDLDKARTHYGSYPDFIAHMNAAAREIIGRLAGADAISFKDVEMAPQGIRFFSKTGV